MKTILSEITKVIYYINNIRVYMKNKNIIQNPSKDLFQIAQNYNN